MDLKNYTKRLAFLFGFSCLITSANAQVVINEYSCANVATIPDNFGNTPDWLELYNSGASAVNLSGYTLSDKISNPGKYTFPSGVSVPANGYLLVWCSGDNTVVGTNVHTNFSLTQTKPEALIFCNSGGVILDSMTLKPTLTDPSRGRTTNGGATWGVFTSPTPGTSNTGAKLEYATLPAMSVAPGFYPGTQNVTLSSPDAGVTIHYTTNGTTPTAASTTYSTPISVSTTTVIRARAFSSNPSVPESFVNSNTYFIGTTHTVPVISLFGDQLANLMGGAYITAEVGLEYYDASKVLKAESDGESNKHGNDSWSYNQRGIDFISQDEFGYNYAVNAKLFVNTPRKSFQRIILKAAANDNYPFETGGAHIRDSYVHTLSQRGNLHLDERTWSPCIVYVNGSYWGVYDLREKVDDNDYTNYYYNQNTPKVEFLQTWGSTWEAYTPSAGVATNDWNTIRSYITSNSMAVQANYDHVDSILNIKSLVDYIVLNSWAVTSDWLNWNTAWWRGLDPAGSGKKWRYTLWDLDATFGHYINYTGIPSQQPNADPCNPESLPDPGGQGHIQILNALMANPGFKQYYEARYIDLMNTTLNCNYTIPLLDSMIAVIQPEMPGQIAKWGGTMTEWQANVAAMKTFINTRCVDINAGLVNCYSLTGPYNVTFDVSPAGAGNIKINSITPSSYIFSGSYFGGIVTKLKATPINTSYVFDHWEMNSHTPSPSTISDSAEVTFTTSDDVVAVFRKSTEPPGGEEVGVPTAFSPNDDGNNDILFVLGSVENLDFSVYNRWGQEVFHTNDRSVGWDGKFAGQKLNPGVFAYRLSGMLPDGTLVNRKGNITLVR